MVLMGTVKDVAYLLLNVASNNIAIAEVICYCFISMLFFVVGFRGGE